MQADAPAKRGSKTGSRDAHTIAALNLGGNDPKSICSENTDNLAVLGRKSTMCRKATSSKVLLNQEISWCARHDSNVRPFDS